MRDFQNQIQLSQIVPCGKIQQKKLPSSIDLCHWPLLFCRQIKKKLWVYKILCLNYSKNPSNNTKEPPFPPSCWNMSKAHYLRQWPKNWCTSPKIIHKITPSVYWYVTTVNSLNQPFEIQLRSLIVVKKTFL